MTVVVTHSINDDEIEYEKDKLSSFEKKAIKTLFAFHSDLHHNEEEIIESSGYDVKAWLLYLDEIDTLVQKETKKKKNDSNNNNHKYEDLLQLRYFVGYRSVSTLPGSYKLWKNHYEFLLSTDYYKLENPRVIISTFESSLRTMNKFPRIWIDYFTFLWKKVDPNKIIINNNNSTAEIGNACTQTKTKKDTIAISHTTFLRKLMNRALEALPISQHDKLWPIFLEYCSTKLQQIDQQQNNQPGEMNQLVEQATTVTNNHHYHQLLIVETCNRLLRRYVQFQPSYRSTLATFFIQQKQWGEAAILFQQIIQEETSSSANMGQTASSSSQPEYGSYWNSLTDLCCSYPIQVEKVGIQWEKILRCAIDNDGGGDVDDDDFENNNKDVTRRRNNISVVLDDMKGMIWSKLADSYIRRGEFDLARSIYEEGLEKISSVRDFTILFDAYLKLEEGLLEVITQQLMEEEEQENEQQQQQEENEKDDLDILLMGNGNDNSSGSSSIAPANNLIMDMEYAMSRAEYLISRRPLLLNRVLIRQNPYNVTTWLQRSELYVSTTTTTKNKNDSSLNEPEMAAATLEEALTVFQNSNKNSLRDRNNKKAISVSPISKIVMELTKIYEVVMGNVPKARELLKNRICNTTTNNWHFLPNSRQSTEDLAECYAMYVEFELRQEMYDDALSLIRSVVLSSNNSNRFNLSKTLRLWNLLLDLEESLGSLQSTKDVYYRAIELKVITSLQVLNFCNFLLDHKYYEEAFTVYERGIELFPFSKNTDNNNGAAMASTKLLWKSYIHNFLKRYQNSNEEVERMRNIFQRCLENCPINECIEFYKMYGEYEEQFGLINRALSIYETMCRKISAANDNKTKSNKGTKNKNNANDNEELIIYQLYILKVIKYRGIIEARAIYQSIIENTSKNKDGNNNNSNDISPATIVGLGLDFISLEISLNEYGRVRAIYQYIAQLANPIHFMSLWNSWNEYEIMYGNEETFRDMLRIKRSIEITYSTTVEYANNKDKNKNGSNNSRNMASTAPGVVKNLTNEEAIQMIANREGVDLDQHNQQNQQSGGLMSGFVRSSNNASLKRDSSHLNSLQEVEERVAKIRKATGALDEEEKQKTIADDDEEIDLDDLNDDDDDDNEKEKEEQKVGNDSSTMMVRNVGTKAIPGTVFGGLLAQKEK